MKEKDHSLSDQEVVEQNCHAILTKGLRIKDGKKVAQKCTLGLRCSLRRKKIREKEEEKKRKRKRVEQKEKKFFLRVKVIQQEAQVYRIALLMLKECIGFFDGLDPFVYGWNDYV